MYHRTNSDPIGRRRVGGPRQQWRHFTHKHVWENLTDERAECENTERLKPERNKSKRSRTTCLKLPHFGPIDALALMLEEMYMYHVCMQSTPLCARRPKPILFVAFVPCNGTFSATWGSLSKVLGTWGRSRMCRARTIACMVALDGIGDIQFHHCKS